MGTIWADSECGATHRDCQSREHQWLVHWGQKEDCTNFHLQGEEFGARQVNPSVYTLLFSLPIFLDNLTGFIFPFFVYMLLTTEASFHSLVLNWVIKLLCVLAGRIRWGRSSAATWQTAWQQRWLPCCTACSWPQSPMQPRSGQQLLKKWANTTLSGTFLTGGWVVRESDDKQGLSCSLWFPHQSVELHRPSPFSAVTKQKLRI